MTKKPTKTKKVNDLDLKLKKLPCDGAFDVKQAGRELFIEGFANKATVDRGDEIIATDAWELDNFKRNPIILFNHGMDTLGGTPVGKATEIEPTKEGLRLKVKISNSQAPGIKMVRDLVEERILKAFSVGFNPKQVDTVEMDGKSVRKISKAELFEVSIVGVPMNQDSLFEITEKSLTTKSFHQLKSEVLKARKNTDAAQRVEELLAKSPARRDVIAAVAKATKLDMMHLLDMLAGERELPKDVEAAFPAAIKQVDLKKTLEEALASLGEGADEATVAADLLGKLGGTSEEEPDPEDQDNSEEAAEGEGEGAGKTDGASGDQSGSGEDGQSDQSTQTDAGKDEEAEKRAKADFQDCVNAKVPKLIEEGMEQDQAVAAAIESCQREGKCQLTPESKTAVFGKVFAALDAGKKEAVDVLADVAFVKQIDEEAQSNQAPTVPVKTEDNPDDFGSPFLEAAKQTNVLLGALISEMQGLRKEIAGLSQSNAAPSKDDPSKGADASSDDPKKVAEDEAKKALDSLNLRLKNLGF